MVGYVTGTSAAHQPTTTRKPTTTMTFTYPRELSFAHPDYQVGCAGTEAPFIGFTGDTFLYVWHKERREYYYYCFEEDMFWGEKEYNDLQAQY